MASRVRFVGGICNKVAMKPDPSYPFEKGDLLFYHSTSKTVRPASAMNAQGTQELDQLGFSDNFAGVADEKYGLETGEVTFNLNQNKSAQVSVCQSGRFEFDCPSQEWTPNQPVGVYSASGAGASDQKVDALKGSATLSAAIGFVSFTEGQVLSPTARTRVVVEIQAAKIQSTTAVAGTYSGTSGV